MSYFNYLRTFVAVYRCGSHRKASEVLGLTQPAISKQIAALEIQIGKPLFHKSGPERFEPTLAGKKLAMEFMPHVDLIGQIFSTARDRASEVSGTIYIGGASDFIEHYLTGTIAKLIADDVSFIMQKDSGRDWIKLLESHMLDMAIVHQVIDAPSIGYREISTLGLVIAFNPDMLASATSSNLVRLPYIAHAESSVSAEQLLPRMGLDMTYSKQVACVPNFHLMKELLLAGVGFCVIPRCLILEDLTVGTLKTIPTSSQIPLCFYLAWNNYAMQQPRQRFVRDAIVESFHKSSRRLVI